MDGVGGDYASVPGSIPFDVRLHVHFFTCTLKELTIL